MPIMSTVMAARPSTYRHPEIMSLLVWRCKLDISPRGSHDDTLAKQSRRLNIIILNSPHTRDKHYNQPLKLVIDIPLLEEDSEAEVLPGSSPLQYKVLVYGCTQKNRLCRLSD
jgi:hypothetical protein